MVIICLIQLVIVANYNVFNVLVLINVRNVYLDFMSIMEHVLDVFHHVLLVMVIILLVYLVNQVIN